MGGHLIFEHTDSTKFLVISKRRLGKAPTGPRKARRDDKLRAVPTKAFREAPMSRYRRLKINGGAFFYTLALADRGATTGR